MNTPITLKVGPKVFGKLSAIKRARSFLDNKDITWDELLEYLLNQSLIFIAYELSEKAHGKPPESLEQFKQNLRYLQGMLDGIGLTTEEAFSNIEQAAETIRTLTK